MIVGSLECSKSSTTRFSVVEMVFTVGYDCNTFLRELTLFDFLVFFLGINLSMSERIISEMREAVLEAQFLKKTER